MPWHGRAVTEVPIVGTWTMHRFGEYVGGACCLLAVAQSFFLIFMHATHYLKPWEQKQYVEAAARKCQ